MSHTSLYYEIKKYCDVIPDYALAFKFAKGKKCFNMVFPMYKEDVLQEIAICCLEAKDIKELGKLLGKHIYYFYHHVTKTIHNPIEQKVTVKYYKYKPDYFNHCDVCSKDKKQYMYKSVLPGKTVCSACRRKAC